MKKFIALSLSDVVFTMIINVKMPTIVCILTFMGRVNFVLSWVKHETGCITSRPGPLVKHWKLQTHFHCLCYAQVTHSRITSPIILRIKSHGWPGNANFRSPIRMHYIRMIKYYYLWLRMQYGKLRTNTDCHVANPASSPWMCDLGIKESKWKA